MANIEAGPIIPKAKTAQELQAEAMAKAEKERLAAQQIENNKILEAAERERKEKEAIAKLQGFGPEKTDMQAMAESMNPKPETIPSEKTAPVYQPVGKALEESGYKLSGEKTVRPEFMPDSNPENKSAAESAGELAATPPSKVGEVLAKLKEEEKKGGPNIFDIIEAAAAGWQGRTPAYVQKALQKAEQEDAMKRMQEAAALESAEKEKQTAEQRSMWEAEMEQERKLNDERMALERLKLGLPGAGSTGSKLNPLDLLGGQ